MCAGVHVIIIGECFNFKLMKELITYTGMSLNLLLRMYWDRPSKFGTQRVSLELTRQRSRVLNSVRI